MQRLQERGVKAAMSMDIVGSQNPVRARLVNFSDQPVLVPRNTYIGDARPSRPDEIIELAQADPEMLEQKLLRVAAAHHPDRHWQDAARHALAEIENEKRAGTYGVAAKAYAAAASNERTRTTQEPCTEEELREMLPKTGTLRDKKGKDGRPYAEHLMDIFQEFSSVFAKDPKNPTVTNLMEFEIDTGDAAAYSRERTTLGTKEKQSTSWNMSEPCSCATKWSQATAHGRATQCWHGKVTR